MMVLSAVLLVISFVALAAMVGRVNQLGSQTASESRKVILDEVGPLADSMNAAIRGFGGGRTVAATWAVDDTLITGPAGSFTTADVGRRVFLDSASLTAGTTVGSYVSATQVRLNTDLPGTSGTVYIDQFRATAAVTGVVTASRPFFTSADVGQAVTGHANIPNGARIVSVTSSTLATISPVPTAAIAATTTLNIGDFALTSTTTPDTEAAVIGMLEHMQNLLASRGLWMDYEVNCVGADVNRGYAEVRLFDGQVWLEVQSTAEFTRDACAVVTG